MPKKKWKREVFPLYKNVTWEVKEGFKSFVADRGAARFDVPEAWVFEPGETSFKFHDREPPDDQCVLEATVFRLPLGVDWGGLPLTTQLAEVTKETPKRELWRGGITRLQRDDLEVAWLESRFVDEGEHREACTRYLLARRVPIQIFISFAFWPDDAARLAPIWDEVVRSLRLAEYMAPPYQANRN